MQDLHLATPEEFDKANKSNQPSPSPLPEPGWLIQMRTQQYLQSTRDLSQLKRHKSVEFITKSAPKLSLASPGIPKDLLDIESQRPKNVDPLHWQLRKEFHLTQYSERRASWSEDRPPEVRRPRQEPPAPPPAPPPLPKTPEPQIPTNLNRHQSRSQLLYPPGSTDNVASEKKPAERPLEKSVYENKPLPPAAVTVKVQPTRIQPSRGPEEDYPERLMSPPPGHQPRGILKQDNRYSSQQQYSSQNYEYSSHQHQQYSEREFREDPRQQQQQQQQQQQPLPVPPPPSQETMRPPSAFQELSEEERYRIMQENLQKHRQPKHPPAKTPVASFNGPFFRIEEVPQQGQQPNNNNGDHHPQQQQQQQRYPPNNHTYVEQRQSYSLQQMKQMSASEVELDKHYQRQEDPSVIVWPPPPTDSRPRSQSVMSRNMHDPDRIDELRRQKALEQEAMRRHEQEKMYSMQKQVRAMQIQQQRLYEQQHGVTSPVPIMEPQQNYNDYSPQQQQPPYQQQDPQSTYNDPPPPPPQNVRVFETRPISSMSDMLDPMTSPTSQANTWKRTYIVEKPQDLAKNEILKSDDLLERENYEIDLLKRREAFVEKPEEAPEIHRTGKRWQPPPEKPYVWPTLRRPISVEPGLEPVDFGPGVPHSMDDGEYKWAPVINDPGFRRERKNFTPTNSPPHSPRRGHGTGPLDEPAKRQTKYVIQPSPDGSHRPKPAFRKERHAPSGGFYPHAPNAIKVVKRRAASVQGLLAPTPNQNHEDVEIIHQNNYHRIDQQQQEHHHHHRSASAVDQRLRREHHHSSQQDLRQINDWDKIYELPPHSSTIVGKDVPRTVDVRRRLNQFEGSIHSGRQSVLRASSVESQNSVAYPPPDYDTTMPSHRRSHQQQQQQQHQHDHRMENNHSRQQVSRRNSVASTRLDTPSRSRQDSVSRQSRSRAASSIPLSPAPRGDTPSAQRVRSQMARNTAPSPNPLSYERARAYLPPPLPGGYRLADPPPDLRAVSPQPGNTKRMIRTVTDSANRVQPSSRTSSRSQSVRDTRLLSPNSRFL